jgi:hypothetical protein
MRQLLIIPVLILTLLVGFHKYSFAGTYKIDGEFNGCDYDKLYPIVGGGILECQEYKYFYVYSPQVRSDGKTVVTIGNKTVKATLHNGSFINTNVSGEFKGCNFNKRIRFQNGLTFVCSEYNYNYDYMPEVKILIISGRTPQVRIGNTVYQGTLYK